MTEEHIPRELEHPAPAVEPPSPHVPAGQEVEFPLPRDPDRRKKFAADSDGLREAAKEVVKEREARQPSAEDVERDYRWNAGHGDRVDPSITVSAERAASDLDRVRQKDHDETHPAADTDKLAAIVDGLRAAYPNRELPADFVPQLQQAAEQAKQQQSQPEPQPQVAEPQVEQQAPVDGIDPEIRAALENPKIRAALEAEVQAAENARHQYAQGARTAVQLSAAAMFSQWPELASLTTEQLPHALAAIQKVDPAKSAAIHAQLQRTQQLWQASRQAEAAQEQIQAQQAAQWARAQDHAYEAAVKDSPEMKSKLGAEAIAMLKEYGASDDDITAAWNSPGVFRSAVGQRVLRDAAAFRLAQKEAHTKLDRSAPPTQRPGVSVDRNAGDDAISSALSKFRADPSPRNASLVLLARRAANSRR
jgi:hypothetical protein